MWYECIEQYDKIYLTTLGETRPHRLVALSDNYVHFTKKELNEFIKKQSKEVVRDGKYLKG